MENINNIKAIKKGNPKLDHGKAWLIESETDIACWIELGIPWHKKQKKNRLPQLMREQSWSSQLTIASNNIHEDSDTQQFGGTAIMAFETATSAVSGTGYDSLGLGRWSWIRLQGKQNKSTTIISAYNPCKSNPD